MTQYQYNQAQLFHLIAEGITLGDYLADPTSAASDYDSLLARALEAGVLVKMNERGFQTKLANSTRKSAASIGMYFATLKVFSKENAKGAKVVTGKDIRVLIGQCHRYNGEAAKVGQPAITGMGYSAAGERADKHTTRQEWVADILAWKPTLVKPVTKVTDATDGPSTPDGKVVVAKGKKKTLNASDSLKAAIASIGDAAKLVADGTITDADLIALSNAYVAFAALYTGDMNVPATVSA